METKLKYYCDSCEKNVETITIVKENTFLIKGNNLLVNSEKRICTECNSNIYDIHLDNEISKLAIKMYSDNYGVKGESIINLRKHYDISQETLAKILGIAKKTINSYETSKSIPNDIYQTVLKRMIEEPEELIKFAEINIEELSNFEKRKIFHNYNYEIKKSKFNSLVVRENSEYTGYTLASPMKLRNIIMFFSKEGIGKTKLAKALFLLDALSYSFNLKGITGLEYIKAQHGPIPKTFGYMIEALIREEILDEQITEKEDDVKYIYFSKDKIDNKIIEDDLGLLNQVLEIIKNNSASKISNFTHTLKGYKETLDKDLISFDYLDDFKLKNLLK